MDDFYVSSRKVGHAMSTKELQNIFRDLGEAARGTQLVLVDRYEKATAAEAAEHAIGFMPASAGTGLAGGGPGGPSHASDHTMHGP